MKRSLNALVMTVTVMALWLPAPRPVKAGRPPIPVPFSWSFTFGPSVGAYIGNSFTATSVTVEATAAYPVYTLLYFWLSTGLRTALSDEHQALFPYAELGFWITFVNVGFGYAAGFNDAQVSPHNVNLFVGVPVCVPYFSVGNHEGSVVLEPYYRYQASVGSDPATHAHEVGLMVEFWLALRD